MNIWWIRWCIWQPGCYENFLFFLLNYFISFTEILSSSFQTNLFLSDHTKSIVFENIPGGTVGFTFVVCFLLLITTNYIDSLDYPLKCVSEMRPFYLRMSKAQNPEHPTPLHSKKGNLSHRQHGFYSRLDSQEYQKRKAKSSLKLWKKTFFHLFHV